MHSLLVASLPGGHRVHGHRSVRSVAHSGLVASSVAPWEMPAGSLPATVLALSFLRRWHVCAPSAALFSSVSQALCVFLSQEGPSAGLIRAAWLS